MVVVLGGSDLARKPRAEVLEMRGCLVMCLMGEIDAYSAEAVARSTFEGFADRHQRNWVLDLSFVGYLDSRGLAVLEKLGFELSAGGKKLVLVDCGGTPSRVLNYSEQYRAQKAKGPKLLVQVEEESFALVRFRSVEEAIASLND